MFTPTPTSAEDSIRQQLQSTMQYNKSLHSDITQSQRNLDELEVSKASTRRELLEASRNKYVLEQLQTREDQSEGTGTREEYISAIKEGEDTAKEIEGEMEEINAQVQQMRESSGEAQKRLTIVRLMSMLDELQTSLNEKINESSEEDEARSQELLKIIQELTRSREKSLALMSKKEREMKAIIQLKKERAAELEQEAEKHKNAQDQLNQDEVLSVAQRIQKERRELVSELRKEEEINNQLTEAIHDVKYAADKNTRAAALSADETMGTSENPEKEMKELRARITAADAERRRLVLKTKELKTRTEEGAEEYSVRMSSLKREILTYQTECARLEKENRELQSLCDSIGQTLQTE